MPTRVWITTQYGSPRSNVGPTSWLAMAGIPAAGTLAVLGLPHVPLPMPTWALGVVTPTCGLTRATVALTRGDFATAWEYNPAAYLVVAFVALVLARLIIGLATRVWITATPRMPTPIWVVLIGAWWVNQQLNADLIINTRLT